MMQSLKEIVPSVEKKINTKFIILEKGIQKGKNKQHLKTCIALVADETAAVHFELWGDECDAFETGDIISLSNGRFLLDNNAFLLRAGMQGKAYKVGEFNMAYVETPNMSEINWGLDSLNSNKFVQKAVVSPYSRIFPPIL